MTFFQKLQYPSYIISEQSHREKEQKQSEITENVLGSGQENLFIALGRK